MSTRGTIGRLNSDGSVDSVYCHFDAYPEALGEILMVYHSSDKDVNHIIELGDTSYIDINLDPKTDLHSWENPEENCSVFYNRDRGYSDTEADHWNNVRTWLHDAPTTYSADFMYLWNGSYWECWNWDGESIDIY